MKFVEDQEWVDNLESEISSFDDLLEEIAYAYEVMYPIRRDKTGIYFIHKLAIGSNWAQYKEHIWRLKPGLYAQLVKFFEVEYE